MSLWNLSQGLHFGFSTISLAEVCVKHLFEESRQDFNPRCGSLCFCLSCAVEVNLCVDHSVLVFEFVFVDLSAFSDHRSHSHPACGFRSGVRRARRQFALWVCVRERTSLKRVRVIQRGERRPPSWQKAQLNRKRKKKKKKKENFIGNHIRSHTSAESKHFVKGENKDYLFVFSSASRRTAVTTFVLILVPVQFYCSILNIFT